MRQLNTSPLFTLKYPLQNQYNTRVCHIISVRIAGGLGGWTPYLTLPTPYIWSKFDPGGRVSTPWTRICNNVKRQIWFLPLLN